MALAEQHEIFRAFIMLMADGPDAPPPAEALDQLTEAVREGAAERVARELRDRRSEAGGAR